MRRDSRNSGDRARRPLLSNGSKITHPLHPIAAKESLPGNKLINTRFPWQRIREKYSWNHWGWCFLSGQPSSYKSSRIPGSTETMVRQRSAYMKISIPPWSKRRPHFETRTCLGENKVLCHESRGDWSQEWLCWRSQQQFNRPTDLWVSSARELQLKDASQRRLEPLDAEAEDGAFLKVATKQGDWGHYSVCDSDLWSVVTSCNSAP
jgi:hypothetical protein